MRDKWGHLVNRFAENRDSAPFFSEKKGAVPGFLRCPHLSLGQVFHFSVLRGDDLNILQKLKVLISCHPDDLHIVLDDKGRDFLIFGNHDWAHRAGI